MSTRRPTTPELANRLRKRGRPQKPKGPPIVKVPKVKKPKIRKPIAPHPNTAILVGRAIFSLAQRRGSSLVAIKKHITEVQNVDAERLSPFIRKYLKTGVISGSLIQAKGSGANGSFKLAKVIPVSNGNTNDDDFRHGDTDDDDFHYGDTDDDNFPPTEIYPKKSPLPLKKPMVQPKKVLVKNKSGAVVKRPPSPKPVPRKVPTFRKAPSPDKTPTVRKAPSLDEIPTMRKAHSPDKTPTMRKAPSPDKTPSMSKAPSPDKTPSMSKAPSPDKTPTMREAPLPDKTPTVRIGPLPDKTPTVKKAPFPDRATSPAGFMSPVREFKGPEKGKKSPFMKGGKKRVHPERYEA